MSGTGENEMGLRKIMDFTRLASMIFLIIHFYYYCYGCFKIWGLTAEIGDRFLQNISRTGFLDSPIKSKVMAFALLIISLLGSKGKKDEKVSVNLVSRFMSDPCYNRLNIINLECLKINRCFFSGSKLAVEIFLAKQDKGEFRKISSHNQ